MVQTMTIEQRGAALAKDGRASITLIFETIEGKSRENVAIAVTLPHGGRVDVLDATLDGALTQAEDLT